MKQIAIYGKGGIGKSTIAANLSAVLGLAGLNGLFDRHFAGSQLAGLLGQSQKRRQFRPVHGCFNPAFNCSYTS